MLVRGDFIVYNNDYFFICETNFSATFVYQMNIYFQDFPKTQFLFYAASLFRNISACFSGIVHLFIFEISPSTRILMWYGTVI